MNLPKIAVNRPITILMVYSALILVGIIALTRLPIELLPNFSFGDITIWTDIRGGMPPEEVENLVTRPIEDSIGSVSHLKDIVSISEEGRSRVVLRFEPGADMDFASLEVREEFSKVKDKLPKEIEKPVIAKFEQSDVPIINMAVTGLGFTPEMLRRIVDETIKPNIQRVEGVANVEVAGGRERKILVEIDQDRLDAHHLAIGKVVNTINLNNLNLLLGDVQRKRNKYIIRAIGEFQTIEDIKNIGIAATPGGSIVRLKDVAEVKDSYLEPTSYSRVNSLPVVSLFVQKETTANTVAVTKDIEEQIEKIRPQIDERIKIVKTFAHADTIKKAIASVNQALLFGAFLAVIVLFLFLRDWRSIIIISVSIPVSVIVTFAFMYFGRITLNIMTLAGLSLGVGMLVDNSIVVLENIFKKKEKGQNNLNATINGSQEVLLAITASTITTLVVFLPIVFVNKEIRILYTGLALTVCFSLVVSLFTSISLLPAMNARFLARMPYISKKPKKTLFKKRFFERIKFSYKKILMLSVRRRGIILLAVFLIFGAAIFVYHKKLEKEFIGTTEQEDFTIFVELPTGAKLDVSDKAVKDIEEILKQIPEVKTATARVEPWSSKIYVKLVSLAQRTRSTKEIIEDLRPKVANVERSYREAFIYFEEPQEIETNEVFIDIFGYDYEKLNEIAVAMLTRMQNIKGLTDLKIRWRKGRPEWKVVVDKQKAADFGLSVEDISETLHAKMRGLRATLYHTQGEEIEVITRLEESDRNTLDKLKKITLTTKDNKKIYLEQIAKLVPGLGPSKIWRKNKERMIQVSANKGRYAFGTAAELIRGAISDLELPPNYYYRFGENYWRMKENQKQLFFALGLTLILIYLVLASLFESFYQPFIIMATVPLAAIGAIFAMWIAKKPVNISALIGAILLGGIVVNNAIVMLDHINNLRKKGFSALRSCIAGANDRLRPILMTSITTIFGVLPMALSRSEQANLWSPLAITIMGGMLTATFLSLVIVPSVYIIFESLIHSHSK